MILHLTLHRRWFDEIASGRKKVEFRVNKKYWRARLENKIFNEIIFANGYHPDAPKICVECKGIDKTQKHYRIKLGEILSKTP